jgi:phosphohistidine swiveling domain-containing protein
MSEKEVLGLSGAGSSVARCTDGTAIPVAWVYAGAEAFEWAHDTEHWPLPLLPMELWLHQRWPAGADRAWEETGMEPPAMFYRFQYVGPFLYARESPYEPERLMRNVMGYRAVAREHGGALSFWQQYCRPRAERACHELAGTEAHASLSSVAEVWAYGFHQTFTSIALLFESSMRLAALLTEAGGEDGSLTLFELTQDGQNATQAIDREIWELAELARATPPVSHLLQSEGDVDVLAALRREPAARTFVVAFNALLERHGSRSQGWDLTLPTWRERPSAPLALVRARLESTGAAPAEVAARSEARRREATERALTQLPAEKHAEFTKALARMDGYVRIREDRAYWQMVLSGEVRSMLLRKGGALAASGRIDRADDVLFLVPSDIEYGATPDLRALASERRREWERWREVGPPSAIGTSPAAPAPIVESALDELRGAPASRGVVTGTARIIRTPDEGARLKSGDIMVCEMSTPAWTPLFAIVAGIITETGGALSHPAITAREYGIPAVVALKDATVRIREGQVVTVDGGTGVVRLR